MGTISSTETSFRDKWENNQDLAFSETLREGSDIQTWILNRNGFKNCEDLKNFLLPKSRILDAGCGNGRVTALIGKLCADKTKVVGIDLVAAKIAEKNNAECGPAAQTEFYARDLMQNLDDLGTFDFIYCQEVLHHTADPIRSFQNLCRLLTPDGEIAIYVYKKKAPSREYVDDFVRQKISGLSYEGAMKVCEQITELGRALSNQNVKVDVPQVDILEIAAGKYDLQRFFYHFFAKCFWNDSLSFKENAAINYDWYHPQLCTRHTIEEIREWFVSENLKIVHEHVDFYGITVRGAQKESLVPILKQLSVNPTNGE